MPGALWPMERTLPILYRRAATYVDKILKGTKPADLPVEQPVEVRAGDQPQGRQGSRPDDSVVRAGAGGPSDPMTGTPEPSRSFQPGAEQTHAADGAQGAPRLIRPVRLPGGRA
jgi:hypothetical protein